MLALLFRMKGPSAGPCISLPQNMAMYLAWTAVPRTGSFVTAPRGFPPRAIAAGPHTRPDRALPEDGPGKLLPTTSTTYRSALGWRYSTAPAGGRI